MRVAKVFDRYSIAINAGQEQGVKPGDLLTVVLDIIDPETDLEIGTLEKVRVIVQDVYPRFCVAATYVLKSDKHRDVYVHVGDRVERTTHIDRPTTTGP